MTGAYTNCTNCGLLPLQAAMARTVKDERDTPRTLLGSSLGETTKALERHLKKHTLLRKEVRASPQQV